MFKYAVMKLIKACGEIRNLLNKTFTPITRLKLHRLNLTTMTVICKFFLK